MIEDRYDSRKYNIHLSLDSEALRVERRYSMYSYILFSNLFTFCVIR